MDERAIGVFDSGAGGLTAVRQLRRLLPGEKLEQIEIDAALPAAIYEATTLRYSCFSLDEAERELNGADTSCILEVLP